MGLWSCDDLFGAVVAVRTLHLLFRLPQDVLFTRTHVASGCRYQSGGGQAMSPTCHGTTSANWLKILDFIVSHCESLVPHEDEHTSSSTLFLRLLFLSLSLAASRSQGETHFFLHLFSLLSFLCTLKVEHALSFSFFSLDCHVPKECTFLLVPW